MLGVDVKPSLLKKFKAKCVLDDTSIKKEIIKFMKSYVGE